MKLVDNRVIGSRGDVLAQKIHGQWQTKDFAVLSFIKEQEQEAAKPKPKPKAKATKPKPAATPKVEEKLEMVRARDENGHFIADDPETEVNEAWVVKTAKKVMKKK